MSLYRPDDEEAARKFAVIAALLQRDASLATCGGGDPLDGCGKPALASAEAVSGVERIVYTCTGCGKAWAQTR